MRRNAILYLALAITLLPAGCSPDGNAGLEKVQAPLTVTDAAIRTGFSGMRGVYDSGGTLTSGSIGVYSFGTGYADANVRYDYGSPSWSAHDSSKAVYLTGNAATLLAYTPYAAGFNLTSVSLSAGPYSESADMCAGTATGVSGTAPSVSFTLGHVYSRLTLSIDTGQSGAVSITNIGVSGPAIYTSATANLTPGAAAVTGKTAGTVSLAPAITNLTAGTPVTESFLLIPAATTDFTGPVVISFTVNGTVQNVSLPVSDPSKSVGLNALTAGMNYVVSVLVQPTAVSVGSVTVNDWTAGTATTLYPVIK